MKIRFGVFALVLGLLVTCWSCKDDDKGEGTLSVRLTDSPADYEEVLIDIQEIRINASSSDEGGWTSLEDINTGVYNLLEFTNGVDTLLADNTLPTGKISQMRLILGDNNQVKIGGVYYNLDTPSSQQSGLKFQINATIEDGITYKIWIDFDAARSIVEKGNGGYSLKPVIRTFTEATSGAIEGNITPIEASPLIYAITSDMDTFSTYADKEDGYFMIRALPSNQYDVKIIPQDGYLEKIITDIDVTNGSVESLGEIQIQSN
ncbi:DUF4382 domain-containing protein [Saccharicrinis aurantiacus]|uniref:DUF4382 domain-containing protein n=1 Tax=Saccharicrinis aurantiacus TaxID=1849719 RepID=UPI002492122D|nr:DUF4382 domain-containing protein [Saccharicrinis aurantiacus]